jgi:hypothetical protein
VIASHLPAVVRDMHSCVRAWSSCFLCLSNHAVRCLSLLLCRFGLRTGSVGIAERPAR